MTLSQADRIWNRAALNAGGPVPGQGDRALAALLLLHNLAMNGGVHHALEGLSLEEHTAACDGYEYFGLSEVASWLRGAQRDPILREWTGETEVLANARYGELVAEDEHLARTFERVLGARPDEFMPIAEA